MSENDSRFEDAIRRAFDSLPFTPCPSDEQLVKFYEGKLSDADCALVLAHLDHCGACDALMLRLRQPDLGIPATQEVKARLRLRVLGGNPSPVSRLRAFFASPIIAYSLCAAALLAMLTVSLARPRTATRSADWGNAAVIELDRTRTGVLTAPPNPLAGARTAILKFFVPVDPTCEYWGKLDDGSSKKLDPSDNLGNFNVAVDSDLLRSSRHTFVVEERTGSSVTKTWHFTFSTR